MCKHFFCVVRIIFPQSKWVHIYNISLLLPYTPPPPAVYFTTIIFLMLFSFFLYAFMLAWLFVALCVYDGIISIL